MKGHAAHAEAISRNSPNPVIGHGPERAGPYFYFLAARPQPGGPHDK